MRRVGAEGTAARNAIIAATEALMLEEGYAAVTARKVAERAGVRPSLLQYYFPKMDDLVVAVYRCGSERVVQHEKAALEADPSPKTLFELTLEPRRTALGQEFMSLANHRKVLQAEIAEQAAHQRALHAEALAQATPGADAEDELLGVAFLITAVARAFVMEQGVGFNVGHKQARAILEKWLGPHAKLPVEPDRGDASAV